MELSLIFFVLAIVSWLIGAFKAYVAKNSPIDFLQLGLAFAGIGLWLF